MITVVARGVDEAISKLSSVPGKIPRVVRAAIKDTTSNTRPFAANLVKTTYTYRRSIRKDMKTRISGTRGEIKVTGRRHLMTSFKHKKPRRGRRGSYFYGEAKAGHGNVHRRAFVHGSVPLARVGAARYPLKALGGPSSAEMVGHEPDVADPILRHIEQRLGVNIERAVSKALGGFI